MSLARGRGWLGVMGLVLAFAAVAAPPHQINGTAPAVDWGPFELHPRAQWRSEGVVVQMAPARGKNRESQISPWDMALGWGVWMDDTVRQSMVVTLGDRWLQFGYARPEEASRLPSEATLLADVAQVHLIPAHAAAQRALDELRAGQRVRLEGWLVDVHHPDGWTWMTSLVRDDTGRGACEILWVTAVQHLPDPGEMGQLAPQANPA